MHKAERDEGQACTASGVEDRQEGWGGGCGGRTGESRQPPRRKMTAQDLLGFPGGQSQEALARARLLWPLLVKRGRKEGSREVRREATTTTP